MIKRPLAFVIPLLLAGCSMAPDYQRPAAPIPTNYVVNTDAIAQDTGWKDVFTDSHLQALIDIALQNNRDQRVAVLNVETYRAQRNNFV